MYRFGTGFYFLGTHLDKMDDLSDWLAGLSSREFLTELIQTRHGVGSLVTAAKMAATAQPYYSMAHEFLNQTRRSEPVSSFLPAYYCALNLAKGSIALTSAYTQLHRRQGHGLSYDPAAKQSRHLLTERLTILRNGIFSLAYEAITNSAIPGISNRVGAVAMQDVYPFLLEIESESATATGTPSRVWRATLEVEEPDDNTPFVRAELDHPEAPTPLTGRRFPVVSGFSPAANGRREYQLGPIDPNVDLSSAVREVVPTWQLIVSAPEPFWGPGQESIRLQTYFPERMKVLQRPEALNWHLALFHMSSLVRYKPEFVYNTVQPSRYWPMLLALRRHAMFKVLLLHIEFARQADIFLESH